MKIVYFGSSPYAKTVLNGIIERGFSPLAVVTRPDSPGGRGLKIKPTPVKEAAVEKNIPVFTPHKLESFPNLHPDYG